MRKSRSFAQRLREIICGKRVKNGVTVALAKKTRNIQWKFGDFTLIKDLMNYVMINI